MDKKIEEIKKSLFSIKSFVKELEKKLEKDDIENLEKSKCNDFLKFISKFINENPLTKEQKIETYET
jgi:hypothetical protein